MVVAAQHQMVPVAWTARPDAPFVGAYCRHRKYGYACVVVGWDAHCNLSEAWQQQMGVKQLRNGPHQPFFNVVASDGSDRYACLENIMVIPPAEVQAELGLLGAAPLPGRPDLGRWFSHWDPERCAFVPIPTLAARFSEDVEHGATWRHEMESLS